MSDTFKDNPPAPNSLSEEQKRRYRIVALETLNNAGMLLARALNSTRIEGRDDLGLLTNMLDTAASYVRRTYGGEAEMGSKMHPGEFDCYADLLPDEPYFLLAGRDDSSPELVEEWATKREVAIMLGDRPPEDMDKVREARLLAERMKSWRRNRYGAWRKEAPIITGSTP